MPLRLFSGKESSSTRAKLIFASSANTEASANEWECAILSYSLVLAPES